MNSNGSRPFRTLLLLARGANLPTVWSNCLAGWWLGGGGNFGKLPFLFLGTSLLYTGGMYLNDAFDIDSDRQRRPGRPIPSGKISAPLVWCLGFSQLALGILFLLFCGKAAAVSAVLLALFILTYDFTHKFFTAAPWLMGACRFWVYVIAGAAGTDGLNGAAIFSGFALGLYAVGFSYLAQRATGRGASPRWPFALLAGPVLLALVMNPGHYRLAAIWVSLVLGLWVARCARPVILGGPVNMGRVAAGLLAGIVFADWLAVAPACPPWLNVTFLALFGLTLLFQRFIPAP